MEAGMVIALFLSFMLGHRFGYHDCEKQREDNE